MSVKPLTDITAAEHGFITMVRSFGLPGPASKYVDLQAPVADDGQTDCWTHAWQVAQARGALYVEGMCRRPQAGGPSMHAWVEEDTPFGRRIIECTPGYEQASGYIGLGIDPSPRSDAAAATADWPANEPRSSIIQAALQSGMPSETVLTHLVARSRAS